MAKIRKRGKTWQIDYFDPTGKRVRVSFKKKKEAEQELGKRVSLIGENRYLDVKKEYKTTLKELIDKYVENFQHQASYKTGKVIEPKEPKAEPVSEVKRSFSSAVNRAGIVNFRFHDLRHTFASQLLMKGGTLKDVQELLGHKTMTMTLRYAHLTQEHKKKAVNLLNGLTASKSEKGLCHKTVTSSNSPVSAFL